MLPLRSLSARCVQAIAGTALLMLLPSAASATSFVYELANHPDGNAALPEYGLRLDELFDVSGGHDIFTFDFDAAGSMMTLVYDDNDTGGLGDDSIRISGIVMGGLDTGMSYGNPLYFGAWRVDFVYTTNITQGGTDIEVGSESPSNQGSITPLFAVGGDAQTQDDPIALLDEEGTFGYSFRFNNLDDHRLAGTGLSGPEIFVGWGWLNHSGEPHVTASDWIFTGTIIPEPQTGVLVALGLATLAATARRRGARAQR